MLPNVTYGEMKKSVSFTGYRPSKLPFLNDPYCDEYKKLKKVLYNEYEKLVLRGYKFFLTGGAMGCDLLAAEVILELRAKYGRRRVAHELCLPCVNHDEKFDDNSKRRLEEIKKKSMVTYVTGGEYTSGCMQRRNKYMVETSSILIAVYDGLSGGTKSTVEYAKKKGKKIIVIRPNDMLKIHFIDTVEDAEQLFLFDDEI